MPKILKFPNPLRRILFPKTSPFSLLPGIIYEPYLQIEAERQKLGLHPRPDSVRGDMDAVQNLQSQIKRLKRQITDLAAHVKH